MRKAFPGFPHTLAFGIITVGNITVREYFILKSLIIKQLLFINYMILILAMGIFIHTQPPLSAPQLVPLVLSTLFLGDITYLASCKLTGKRMLFLFCGLLAADSWFLVLAMIPGDEARIWFRLAGCVLLYLSIRFCLLFLFQSYYYRWKKAADILLSIFFLFAAGCAFFSDRVYACAYGIQFAGSILCFIFIIFYHRKRAAYVLKTEKKAFLLSFAVTLTVFFLYYMLTIDIRNHLGNFGTYLSVLLFFISIHGIVLKETDGTPLSAVFGPGQRVLLGVLLTGLLASLCLILNDTPAEFFLLINLALAMIFLCNILLGETLKRNASPLLKTSRYTDALNQLKQEEKLKETFADFLHDEVLQDLLSVKNMAGKSARPEIRTLMCDTLDQLNIRIRSQMQDYHPILLKSLTLKENLTELIRSIQTLFPQKNLQISFICADTLFIPEPYDMLIYRLIRELVTNIYKHSDGNQAQITLSLEKDQVTLCIWDNGKSYVPEDIGRKESPIWHKGLSSLEEQIDRLGGSISISRQTPEGVRTNIQFSMKGDVSYKHFVS